IAMPDPQPTTSTTAGGAGRQGVGRSSSELLASRGELRRLRRELLERVRRGYIPLDRRVDQPLGVGAELGVPLRRTAREERLDVLQLGADDRPALELPGLAQRVHAGGPAGQEA